MTTRLNAFFIELCNMIKNLFPFLKDGAVKFREAITIWTGMPLSSKCSLMEFNQCCTNWFFVIKKWKYFWKKRRKSKSAQPPCHLVSMKRFEATPVYKVELSSKSFRNPKQAWIFCVVKLQLNFISRIGSIWRKISLNPQTTLCINKTRKICVIFNRWLNGVSNGFKGFLDIILNHVRLFCIFHLYQNLSFFFFRSGLPEFFKEIKLVFFLYEIRLKWNGFYAFSRKYVSMNRFMPWFITWGKGIGATYFLNHPYYIGLIDCVYDQGRLKFSSSPCLLFSNREATITVNISRKISQISRVFTHNEIIVSFPSI